LSGTFKQGTPGLKLSWKLLGLYIILFLFIIFIIDGIIYQLIMIKRRLLLLTISKMDIVIV